ncbi:MAG: cation:proton antiporter [Paludibacteraceae bacterium]|nr:cation:proton antiporter [Paludibacteraceae bacterium]
MENLPPLISDLAYILLCAGVMSILFKSLKQPVVLGYIVAGFLAGPHMTYTQSILDISSIETWADIGIIFLLFTLGLEFSFKKLFRIGTAPFIAVAVSLCSMIMIGLILGYSFGWRGMDGLYLGGMMAIASTSIVIKTFGDLGLMQQKFASLVFSVLIIEDIIAIVMMLLFGTLGEGRGLDGLALVKSIGSMFFYLILWFLLGIYLIPIILKHFKTKLNNETLLIVSLSLCFAMVVLASIAGFSAAFGAFVMGSILAETIESERIEHIVTPIKDLFGAIFFVSVGMMIDPTMLVQYWVPILVIALVMIFGRSTIETIAFLLGGVNFKTAMQCGYSLAQVGEFSFIIATLGISLGAISEFLYPIIVSVSVITTFTTPYMIRAAKPVSEFIEPRLPESLRRTIERYSSGSDSVHHSSKWKPMLQRMLTPLFIYGVLVLAVALLMVYVGLPFAQKFLPETSARITCTAIMMALQLIFLWPLMFKNIFDATFWQWWNDRELNRASILAMVIIRILTGVTIINLSIRALYPSYWVVAVGFILSVLALVLFSRLFRKNQERMETIFLNNLNSKEQAKNLNRPAYEGQLQSKDIHLADIVLPESSHWCGQSLRQLNWGHEYDVHVMAIIRNGVHLNIPAPESQLFPGDKVQVVGSDENLARFVEALQLSAQEQAKEQADVQLYQVPIPENSPLAGKHIFECGIRTDYRGLIVGIDRGDDQLIKPNVDLVLQAGDIVWVVGEPSGIRDLQTYAGNY